MARPNEYSESLTPAVRYALKLLSMRGRTQKELAAALERKGFLTEQSSVLEQLRRWGYVDDARYAKDRASSLLRIGRIGVDAVTRRLIAAGISEGEARKAIEWARAEVGFDEFETARALLAKRGLTPAATQDERVRSKAARLLRTRGFTAAIAERLLGVELDSPSEEG